MSEWIEFTAKTVDEALTEALIQLGTTSDKVEYKVLEQESVGFFGLFSKMAKIEVKVKENEKPPIEKFLNDVFSAMNMEVDLDIEYNTEESTVDINVKGEEMGILIGKRGQTLDSLQYLVSLVANKESQSYIKVKLDTENYRERRKETLENLAKNIAEKVKRNRRPVILEPMNPYERRIIHSALQTDKSVETHSEGNEPYRKVVVTLRKGYGGDSRESHGRYNKRSTNRYQKGSGNPTYKR